jgi:serine phosphatase RsbU (regulator of sigma subunit)
MGASPLDVAPPPLPDPQPQASGEPGLAPRRYLRAFIRALTDEGTFDLKGNPSLWLGFLLALPIPILTFAADADLWLKLCSLPAPVVWAVMLGAAGRVGILAEQEKKRLLVEVERTRTLAVATQRTLVEEVSLRKTLEARQKEVLNELKLAQSVQKTLVPQDIVRPDLQVAVKHIPSQFVGGDYLHAVIVDNRTAYLCLGDVSGHGVAAALVVARFHGLVRRLTLESQAHPETFLERLNDGAMRLFQHTYFFMTFAVLKLDLQTGELVYATAGHPAQVLLRADGRMELLHTPNRLLGMDADVFDAERPSDRVRLEPGDSLVLFTDGLFEVLSGTSGEILGEQGLHDRIASLRGLAPPLLAGEILQDLADFQGHSTFEDDVSLMVATWNGPAAGTPSA